MGILLDKKINEIKAVLFDKSPRYQCIIPVKNSHERYNEYFGYYRSPEHFKRIFGGKYSDLTSYIRTQKSVYNFTRNYFQEIINELKKTVETFELKNIRGEEFHFQEKAIIRIRKGFESNETSIEDVEDDFFQQIIQISQLKYDFTIKLMEELKEIADMVKDNELNVDIFFDLILDNTPFFKGVDKIEYNEYNQMEIGRITEYQNFEYPDEYFETLQFVARKIIMHFINEYSLKNIEDKYIEGYLHQLKSQKENFILRSMDCKEYLCHKRAYYHIPFPEPDELKQTYQLEELLYDNEIQKISNYSKNHYDIIVYLIDGIEKILNYPSVDNDNLERLELDIPVSDIALLFRLLKENKVIKAKHNTHIYRVIQNSFTIPAKTKINEGTIKNAFNDPDPNAVKNVDLLLTNLKTLLKKIH